MRVPANLQRLEGLLDSPPILVGGEEEDLMTRLGEYPRLLLYTHVRRIGPAKEQHPDPHHQANLCSPLRCSTIEPTRWNTTGSIATGPPTM